MGEFALTQQVLDSALRHTAEWVGDHDIYAALVDTAARSRNREVLLQIAPAAEETARHYEHRLYLGIAQRAWGVLHMLDGAADKATERFEEARRLFNDLGVRWQLGRTYFHLGELAAGSGRVVEAVQALDEARRLFEEAQAPADLRLTRELLEGLRKSP